MIISTNYMRLLTGVKRSDSTKISFLVPGLAAILDLGLYKKIGMMGFLGDFWYYFCEG